MFRLPLHVRLLNGDFPRAQQVPMANAREVLREVCQGTVNAGFLEKRAAVLALEEAPPECAPAAIRVHTLSNLILRNCVALHP
jgi:hypothetical protein